MNDRQPALVELLQSLCRVARAEQRLRGAGDQLQPVHIEALSYLDRANRYSNTPQALTEYLGATKGTVSQSLLLLYRRGLVKREADPSDGRIVRLRLSARGHKMLAALVVNDEWRQAFARLPKKQVQIATQVLGGALLNLQRSRGGKTFGVCRTCAQFRTEGRHRFRCGLTGEPLSEDDAGRICREHDPSLHSS